MRKACLVKACVGEKVPGAVDDQVDDAVDELQSTADCRQAALLLQYLAGFMLVIGPCCGCNRSYPRMCPVQSNSIPLRVRNWPHLSHAIGCPRHGFPH